MKNHESVQGPTLDTDEMYDILRHVLLTVRNAARVCEVSERTVYNWMAFEGLPFIKVGKSRRIPVKALDIWIESRTEIEF